MSPDGPLRRNAFLIAAIALPGVVVLLFAASTVVPRWLVDPPAYDLIFEVAGPYDPSAAGVAVDLAVDGGRLVVTYRSIDENRYPSRPSLFRFDHRTGTVTEIALVVPDDFEPDQVRTVAVAAFEGQRLLPQASAPDGYTLETRRRSRPGLLGELIGIGGARMAPVLVKGGRVVPLDLPAGTSSAVSSLGWIAEAGEGG